MQHLVCRQVQKFNVNCVISNPDEYTGRAEVTKWWRVRYARGPFVMPGPLFQPAENFENTRREQSLFAALKRT